MDNDLFCSVCGSEILDGLCACPDSTTDTALAAAEARIAELEKALGPFAREAGTWGEHEDETEIVKTCNQTSFFPINSTFTVGDLRRAAALLKEKE